MTHVARVEVAVGHHARFLAYLHASLHSQRVNTRSIKQTTGIQNLDAGMYFDEVVAVPPLLVQRGIASFLDRKTAAIDALIEKKERLVALLQEKRQALVTQAVTKGLDPSVPTKGSGLEWVGAIPKHWTVGPLRRWWSVLDCKHRTVPFIEDGVPVVSIGELHGLEVDVSGAKRTTPEEARQMIGGARDPRPGDVIYSRNATVGEAAVVTATTAPFCMGQDVSLIRGGAQSGRFLTHQLRSPFVLNQLESVMVGATFRRINVSAIKDLVVCVPPRSEQDEISRFCDRLLERTNTFVSNLTLSVAALREYRQALITAAVTGKLDLSKQEAP